MKWLPLLLLAVPAAAQDMYCGTRDGMARELADNWGEVSIFRGLSGDEKTVLEIFASPSGTWTALVVTSDGRACVPGAGKVYVATGVRQGTDG